MSEQNESSQDRDLPASERKLAKAREQGQVVRSRDLSSALGLSAGVFGLVALGASLLDACRKLVGNGLRFDQKLLSEGPRPLNTRLLETSFDLGYQALSGVLPVLLLCAFGAVIGQIALGGIALTTHPMMPDFSRISPAKGFSRLASKHNLMEFGKLLIVVTTLIVVAVLYVNSRAETLPALGMMARDMALSESLQWLRNGAIALLGVLILAALIDAPLQWIRHHSQLKMTLQEVKQESKESDGDPHVRARIKSRQRELARSRMMAAVPGASVIVTNPTHFAVALRYDEGSAGAPKVVAKGVDLLAGKIREAGAAAGVPILEAPPLARALYAHAKIGMEVPPALYTAVAQVLAYIYQLRMHMAAQVPGMQKPQLPQELAVPAELDPGTGNVAPDSDIEDEVSEAPVMQSAGAQP